MQQVAVNIQYNVVGETFGARGCSSSCSCNPCDCNPCTCGSDDSLQPNYPYWRISGYALRKGSIDYIDISQCVLISLAQPQDKSILAGLWSEVILVNESATDTQIQALLALFEEQLHSLPVEAGVQPHGQRAVYRVPMRYSRSSTGPHLSLTFQPAENRPVRIGETQLPLQAWDYQGLLALRDIFRYRR